MDATFNTQCTPLLNTAWQGQSRKGGVFAWIRRLADEFPYPEIKSGDYRIAEYIPQDWDSRKS